jgi:acetylornithine deacetylase/succinyl-diaminopimelate desuccinylase-like protein
VSDWQTYLEANRDRFLDDLKSYLRIPSISSLPEHADDVAAAAKWVAERMRAIGVENVAVLPTGGHPVVYGDHLHAPGAPTILIYGHVDVQPTDPLELWDHPPFEPHVEGGRIVARGSNDDKGPSLAPLMAVEALLATEGALPVNVKFLYEGQEEIGSPQLPDFIAAERERLACDLVLSADGMQYDEGQPALWLALKGMCALQIDVKGANSDLHSGIFGGVAPNPLHALATILASLRDEGNVIRVEGFYDDVVPLTDADREQIAAVPFDDEAVKAELGVSALAPERGYTPREHNWARPTLEINGVWGGFQGAGVKTVIPSEAHAKITCRLVANQDPVAVAEAIARHARAHAPAGVTVDVAIDPQQVRAYLMPANHPGNGVARKVHLELFGVEPYHLRIGGSLPFCTLMLDLLGAYTVNFAFALLDEKQHAPNEFFRLENFELGARAYVRILQELAEADLSG